MLLCLLFQHHHHLTMTTFQTFLLRLILDTEPADLHGVSRLGSDSRVVLIRDVGYLVFCDDRVVLIRYMVSLVFCDSQDVCWAECNTSVFYDDVALLTYNIILSLHCHLLILLVVVLDCISRLCRVLQCWPLSEVLSAVLIKGYVEVSLLAN